MPKWGACWGMACLGTFLQIHRDAGQDIGHRDVAIIACRIDHLGSIESADPGIFIYVIQEVLRILLVEREKVCAGLAKHSEEIYPNLVEAAFRMRELTLKNGCAFWTSGYEFDRERLIETMRRCNLPANSAEYELPPHVQQFRRELQWLYDAQIQSLHQLAQSGVFSKDVRKRLHEIKSA
jgi:hypothetical protein